MAKKKNSPAKPLRPTPPAAVPAQPALSENKFLAQWIAYFPWIVALLAVVLYVNTLGHGYTLDDAIVIYDNMFTTAGVKGWPGLLLNDTFYGFFKEQGKEDLVAGGRYRPLTPMMFALEWQLFGRNPFMGHLLNVVFYALTGWMTYRVLLTWFNKKWPQAAATLALAAAVLFVAHPIHTEAVSNIKGRDEIMSLLLSLLSCLFLWKAVVEQKGVLWQVMSGVSLFLALMSKENAVAFVALAPLSLWVFGGTEPSRVIESAWPLLAGALLFLLLRHIAIGQLFTQRQMELMNNPFLKLENGQWVAFSGSERLGTIMLTLLKYLILFVWPYPLTHDYYPRHIDISTMGHPMALGGLLVYGALTFMAFRVFKQRSVLAYGIAFYLATLFIVSNIIFPIGTNMGERFVFMPSLGLCMVAVLLLFGQGRETGFRFDSWRLGLLGIIVAVFGFLTVNRNPAWKDDFTLFTTDVKTSPRSAKLQNACAGAKVNEAVKLKMDDPRRSQLLNEAAEHAKAAVDIHPTYRNAWTILGHSYYYNNKLDDAIKAYETAQAYDQDFIESKKGLTMAYRDRGKQAGEREGNLDAALSWLNKAYERDPKDAETLRLLGVAHGIKGNSTEAVRFFKSAVDLQPDNSAALYDYGVSLIQIGNAEEGKRYQQKALAINPNLIQERAARTGQ